MDQNPYAPPTTSAAPPTEGLVFSEEGVQVVASMAKWMRALSTIYYIGAAIVMLSMLGMGAMAGRAPGPLVIVMVVVVLVTVTMLGVLGTVLRDAAGYFENGVIGDDEFSLGLGFRKLRTLFIVFGILGILTLLSTINDAMGGL